MPAEEKQEQQAEPKPFDGAAWMKSRNEAAAKPGQPAPETKPPATETKPAKAETKPVNGEAKPAATETEPEEDDHRLTRSQRRENNRLREEAAEARGRLAAYQEFATTQKSPSNEGAKQEVAATEPTRDQFQTEAEFSKAIAKWERAQGVREFEAKQQQDAQTEAFMRAVRENTDKFNEDTKLFPDWAEVAEEMNAMPLDTAKQATLVALLGQSDVRAHVTYYFAKHKDEFTEFLKLSPNDQIKVFHRLEGRMDAEYSKATTEKAAQAPPATPAGKDRTPPEKPAQGSATAADRDVRKPRPSTEVAARGGSAIPEDPLPGTIEWMRRRNQAQFGR
jgi:hypothetical protein